MAYINANQQFYISKLRFSLVVFRDTSRKPRCAAKGKYTFCDESNILRIVLKELINFAIKLIFFIAETRAWRWDASPVAFVVRGFCSPPDGPEWLRVYGRVLQANRWGEWIAACILNSHQISYGVTAHMSSKVHMSEGSLVRWSTCPKGFVIRKKHVVKQSIFVTENINPTPNQPWRWIYHTLLDEACSFLFRQGSSVKITFWCKVEGTF